MRYMQRGFTLLELMVAVAIIGILAGVALPQFRSYVQRSADGACLEEASAISRAVAIALSQNDSALLNGLTMSACDTGVLPPDLLAAANTSAQFQNAARGSRVITCNFTLGTCN